MLAYHDRSDGGVLVTLAEMAFAGHTGLDIELPVQGGNLFTAAFCEELGAVIQVPRSQLCQVIERLHARGFTGHVHPIARVNQDLRFRVSTRGEVVLDEPLMELRSHFSDTTLRIQALRDNPETAAQEHAAVTSALAAGLRPRLSFDPKEVPEQVSRGIASSGRPLVAILREQGVNGHLEMAAAFDRAGFTAVDVHMTDILQGKEDLRRFRGLAACGGFSYGDVLGGGGGWAKSILFNPSARMALATFFARQDTFTLGVCNGCQMLSVLKPLIPGAGHWPKFVRNRSEQFEARLSLVEVMPSPSVFFAGMEGSRLLVPVAHGEGRAEFAETELPATCPGVALRFVDGDGAAAEHYPANPNGSPLGITGLCSDDGRATIVMPHPERAFRSVQHSWAPGRFGELEHWGEDGPWMRMFYNARAWVERVPRG